MKIIKVGEKNDIYMFAAKDEDSGRYYPLSEIDLDYQKPDAKIYYDRGIYPSITQSELPQYICNKASQE